MERGGSGYRGLLLAIGREARSQMLVFGCQPPAVRFQLSKHIHMHAQTPASLVRGQRTQPYSRRWAQAARTAWLNGSRTLSLRSPHVWHSAAF